MTKNATTQTTISEMVTTGASVPAWTAAAARLPGVRPAHSGQRIPTGLAVMQSVQIGRPQPEQETPVSRPGCR